MLITDEPVNFVFFAVLKVNFLKLWIKERTFFRCNESECETKGEAISELQHSGKAAMINKGSA